MSKRADFYLIDATDTLGQFQFACRLLEKAYLHKQHTFVCCDNAAAAERVDELLWTFKEDSFIPHSLGCEGVSAPIHIGDFSVASQNRDLLLNLSSKIPGDFQQFNRVIEIVLADPESKKNARARYSHYREAGWQLHSHDMSKAQ